MSTDGLCHPIVDAISQKLSRKSRNCRLGSSIPRSFLTACLSTFFVATCFAEETYDLKFSLKTDSVQQVQAVVEVRGDLLVQAGEGEQQKLPIVVSGKVTYDERMLAIDTAKGSRRSVRNYREASAEVKVGQGLATPQINAERRLVVAEIDAGGSTLFCPMGPLSREDLELIDIQGNSLAVSGLLPDQPVRAGETWQLNREFLAILLGLDVITSSDVQGTLDKMDGKTAILTIQGSLEGAAQGVAAKIELKAKANFDTAQRAVTWLAANFRERREISHAEPGFDVTARLRVAITPQTAADALSDTALRDLPLTATAGATLLELHPQHSDFRLIHDRRWRVLLDRHDLCVLRCVDGGDLIAQCNLSELPDAEPGKRLALEAFQAEVLESLTSSAGQVVEASQSTTDDGRRLLRVQATGIASEVPIAWVFYHVSNEQGRQAALSFTLESKAVERFAEGDRTLAESLTFAPRTQLQEAKLPAPAAPSSSR
jgi:hypothetical protein